MVPRATSTRKLEAYAISDLHTDHPDNMKWVKSHCKMMQGQKEVIRVLLVAGDISDDIDTLKETLSLLQEHYICIFIPGNHELWISSSDGDSVEKLTRVLKVCEELGIHTEPCSLGLLSILPLHSWHHSSFDREPDIAGVPKASTLTIGDYAKCRWPAWLYDSFTDDPDQSETHGSISLALWADSLNNRLDTIQDSSAEFVISFSHFVPDQRLMPEKRFLTYPNLMKAVGSEPLGKRVRALQPDIHIFGHSHFSWDARLDGDCSNRFISAPLCYPREREMRMKSISISSSWQDNIDNSKEDGLTMPCLPLLIYRATFTSDGKAAAADNSSTTTSSSQLKDLLGHSNVRQWSGEGIPYPLGGAMWAKYYRINKRTPENVEMAPWVKGRYAKRIQRLS